MTTDSDWVWQHYETRHNPNTGKPFLACKRCDMDVYGLTAHARNLHGDDVGLLDVQIADLLL